MRSSPPRSAPSCAPAERASIVGDLLVLDAERDRLPLIRLRVAVRADVDRSAMIYTASDLARWIERCLERRGLQVTILADGDGLRVTDGDPAAVDLVRTAAATGSFGPG